MGTAPGSFEPVHGILRSISSMTLGFEPLVVNFEELNLREPTVRKGVHRLRVVATISSIRRGATQFRSRRSEVEAGLAR